MNYNKLFKSKRKAFTLIELLIVIVIIGILFVVLVAKLSSTDEKARFVGVQNDFHNIQTCLYSIFTENDGVPSDINTLYDLLADSLAISLENAVLTTEQKDPWGNEYNLILDSEYSNKGNSVILLSAGPDRYFSTSDDIIQVLTYCTDESGHYIEIENKVGEYCIHDFNNWIIESNVTCIENGLKSKTCSKCNKKITEQIISNGHNYIRNICTVCGEHKLQPGLYATNSNLEVVVYTWEELIEQKIISDKGLIYGHKFYGTDDERAIELLSGELVLPDTVKRLDNYAFSGCKNLTGIVLPDNITTIDMDAFSGCSSLQYIYMSPKTKTISSCAFSGCTSLKEIYMGNSVSYIGQHAFGRCSSLTEIYIPKSVTKMFNYSFSDCTSLANVYYEGSIEDWMNIDFNHGNPNPLSFGANLYVNSNEIVTKVVVPENMTNIGPNVFHGCGSIKEIVLHNNIESIGDGAFAKTNIEYIEIPYSVVSLGYGVFQNSNIKECVINANIKELPQSTFYNCKQLERVTINNVEVILKQALYGCVNLKSVTVPTSLKIINESAFEQCDGLASLDFSNTALQTIGKRAFYHCDNLAHIQWNNDLAEIGTEAFEYCNALTDLDFSKTKLTYIRSSAFERCENIGNVVLPSTISSLETNAFASSGIKSINIPSSVETLGKSLFRYCQRLTSITFDNTINAKILPYEFVYYCPITELVLPDGLEIFEASCLDSCSKLTTVRIPNSLKEFNGFRACDNIQLEVLGDAYYLGNETNPYLICMKYKNYNVEVINIPEGTKFINNSAFSGCRKLKNVSLPSTLVSIGANAFSYSIIETLYIPSNVQVIKNGILSHNNVLTNITVDINNPYFKVINNVLVDVKNDTAVFALPNANAIPNVSIIGESLFSNHKTTFVYIPKTVNEIKQWAFAYAYDLDTIYYEGTEDEWNSIVKASVWDSQMGKNSSDGTYKVIFNCNQ